MWLCADRGRELLQPVGKADSERGAEWGARARAWRSKDLFTSSYAIQQVSVRFTRLWVRAYPPLLWKVYQLHVAKAKLGIFQVLWPASEGPGPAAWIEPLSKMGFQKAELSVMLCSWEPTCEDKVLKGDCGGNAEPGPSGPPTTTMTGPSAAVPEGEDRAPSTWAAGWLCREWPCAPPRGSTLSYPWPPALESRIYDKILYCLSQ